MFGKQKPPTEEMIALRAAEDNAGALKLALRYMGKTNKPLIKYDNDFLLQTASLYFEIDENELKVIDSNENQTANIIEGEVQTLPPNWRTQGDKELKRTSLQLEACTLIANRVFANVKRRGSNGQTALLLIGSCCLETNNFDKAEKYFDDTISTTMEGEDKTSAGWLIATSLTSKGLIAYARDYDPEGAIRFFDMVLEKKPKFEPTLLFKNDIITMQKGGTGKLLNSITDMKKLLIPGTTKAIWKKI